MSLNPPADAHLQVHTFTTVMQSVSSFKWSFWQHFEDHRNFRHYKQIFSSLLSIKYVASLLDPLEGRNIFST